jgi:hypothetical protein
MQPRAAQNARTGERATRRGVTAGRATSEGCHPGPAQAREPEPLPLLGAATLRPFSAGVALAFGRASVHPVRGRQGPTCRFLAVDLTLSQLKVAEKTLHTATFSRAWQVFGKYWCAAGGVASGGTAARGAAGRCV